MKKIVSNALTVFLFLTLFLAPSQHDYKSFHSINKNEFPPEHIFVKSSVIVTDYYIQQGNNFSHQIKSLKQKNRNSGFEKNFSEQFLNIIKNQLTPFIYSQNLYSCNYRCINPSKYKRNVIRRQTVL